MRRRGLGPLFWVCCVFLLFFRAKWAFLPEWTSDEGCYLSHLYRWLALDPGGGCTPNPVAIGAPLLWLAPGLAGRALAAVTGGAPSDWILPLVALASFALWGAGFCFLDAAVGTWRKERRAPWTFALAFSVPALYYATHRAMMSHTAEFAAAMALLYFARARGARDTRAPGVRDRARSLRGAWLAAGLLTITRYNDAPALLIPLAMQLESALAQASAAGERQGAQTPLFSALMRPPVLVAGALVAVAFGWFAFAHGYGGFTLPDLLASYSIDGVADVLVGWNFGLLWTAVPWLASLFAGFVFARCLSWPARAALAWLLAEGLLVGGWIGNGSDFGYRYLIGSYAACFLIALELLEKGLVKERLARVVVTAQAAFLTWLLIAFKTVPTTGMGDLTLGGRGSNVIPRLLEAPLEPKFFKVVGVGQFPPVTLALSYFFSDRPGYSFYSVHGPALIILCVVTASAFAWMGRALYSDGFTC